MTNLCFRNFFLTQFADNENLEETGILEMDLAQLSFPDECAGDFITELSSQAEGQSQGQSQGHPHCNTSHTQPVTLSLSLSACHTQPVTLGLVVHTHNTSHPMACLENWLFMMCMHLEFDVLSCMWCYFIKHEHTITSNWLVFVFCVKIYHVVTQSLTVTDIYNVYCNMIVIDIYCNMYSLCTQSMYTVICTLYTRSMYTVICTLYTRSMYTVICTLCTQSMYTVICTLSALSLCIL